MSRPVIAVEISYRDVTASPIAAAKAYIASEGFITKATDTLANTYFAGRLDGDTSYRIRISAPFWGEGSGVAIGAIEIINDDGGLDDWADFEFKGHDIAVKLHTEGASYNSAKVLLNGTIDHLEPVDEQRMRLVIRDPAWDLRKPLTDETYDNTTDAEGVLKPRAFGIPKLCPPVLVSANDLEYHAHAEAILGMDKVYDQGVEVDYVPVSKGFRLTASPAGKILCNPIVSGAGSNPTLTEDTQTPKRWLVTGGGRTMTENGLQRYVTEVDSARASTDGGKYYFEMLVEHSAIGSVSHDGLAWDIGVGVATATPSNPQTPSEAGFWTLTGRAFIANALPSPQELGGRYTAHNNGTSEAEGADLGDTLDGDLIGVLVDFDSSPMTIEYYRNGTTFAGPFQIPAGTYKPVLGVAFNNTGENSATINLVAEDLAQSVPSGYTAWGVGVTADSTFDKLTESITDMLPDIEFDSTSVATINALAHSSPAVEYTYGYYLRETTTAADVLQAAMASIGGYYFVNRLGKVQVGQLTAPGTSVRTLTDTQIAGQISIEPDGAPGLSDGIGSSRNWDQYRESEVAGSVTETFKQQISRRYQTEYRTSTQVAEPYEHAIGRPLMDTMLIDDTAASNELERFASLYDSERKFYRVPIALEAVNFDDILDELGETYTIETDRFGMAAGLLLVLVGVEGNFLDNDVQLIMWGGGTTAPAVGETATLVFHALDESAGSFSADVIVGTGSLSEGCTSTRWHSDDGGVYQDYASTVPGEAYAAAEWHVQAQPALTNLLPQSSNLAHAAWTEGGTSVAAQNATGMDGSANGATTLTDNSGTGIEFVWEAVAITEDAVHSAVIHILKDSDTSRFVGIQFGFNTIDQTFGGEDPRAVYHLNTETGAITQVSSAQGINVIDAIARDAGDWWEVVIGADDGAATGNGFAVIGIYPADGSVFGTRSNAATGSCVVGNVGIYQASPYTVAGCGPVFTSGTSAGTVATDLALNDANHDNEAGGYYLEWRPTFSTSEADGNIEILSLNSAAGLLFYDADNSLLKSTDGANTASVALTVTKDTTYKLWVAYGGSSLQVGYNSSEGSAASYDGAFSSGSELELCTPAAHAQMARNLRRYAGTFSQCKTAVSDLASA